MTDDLHDAVVTSSKAAKASRRELRREAWAESKDKDIAYIFLMLGLAALMVMTSFSLILLLDPNVPVSTKAAGETGILGLWFAAMAGLVAGYISAMKSRLHGRAY